MKGIGEREALAHCAHMAISVPSQFHISVCTSEFRRLDWTGAIPPLINTPSSLDRRCCYNWFLPAADFRPDPPLALGRAGGSADKKFSSCFLNSYIIQTHFRMKPEEPPPAPVARLGGGGGSQTEVICFRSYQSHSLETGNGFALCPPPSPSSSSIATSSSG